MAYEPIAMTRLLHFVFRRSHQPDAGAKKYKSQDPVHKEATDIPARTGGIDK